METICAFRTLKPPGPILERWIPKVDGKTTGLLVAGGDEPYEDSVREHAHELSTTYDVPIYIVNGKGREALYSVRDNLIGNSDAQHQLELLRTRRRYSYGVGTDDAYSAANALDAECVQFIDDDTGPIPGIDVVSRHRDIIKARRAVAVTGDYLGDGWLATNLFPRPSQGACIASEFMRHLPSRGPVQTTVTSLFAQVDEPADFLIGGVSMVSPEMYRVLPCCAIPEATGTDDIFPGFLASRVFPGRVRRSGAAVIHFHAAGRKELPQVRKYLRNVTRAVAFFALLNGDWLDWLTGILLANIAGQRATVTKCPALDDLAARQAVTRFFMQLQQTKEEASDRLPLPIAQVIDALDKDGSGRTAFEETMGVIETAMDGLREYAQLLAAWPCILKAMDEDIRARFKAAAQC